ncbi:MAG: hypothetical protein P0116_12205 [Candidatus Nitrosocosmicus sp.]|nr:hypothetical protein [Candidatus Nitrosocosmicus sp.]
MITSQFVIQHQNTGYTSEERSKDFLNALYTSIVSSERRLQSDDLANLLEKLSEIDLFVDRIYEKRIGAYSGTPTTCSSTNYLGLVKIKRKNNKYSVPFSSMGPIFMRGNH